eukprot:8609007-Karenia_brevis.AAC.1
MALGQQSCDDLKQRQQATAGQRMREEGSSTSAEHDSGKSLRRFEKSVWEAQSSSEAASHFCCNVEQRNWDGGSSSRWSRD